MYESDSAAGVVACNTSWCWVSLLVLRPGVGVVVCWVLGFRVGWCNITSVVSGGVWVWVAILVCALRYCLVVLWYWRCGFWYYGLEPVGFGFIFAWCCFGLGALWVALRGGFWFVAGFMLLWVLDC